MKQKYTFEVPCDLLNYDIDHNDIISIDEFATALQNKVGNTGVREVFVVFDKNGKI